MGEQVKLTTLDVPSIIVHTMITYSMISTPGQCSPELGRALRLFEQLINDPKNHCRLAEGARLLGEQRVCRINVDIDLGQNTVLYCLEGERLSTALTVVSLTRRFTYVHLCNCTFYIRVPNIASHPPNHPCWLLHVHVCNTQHTR